MVKANTLQILWDKLARNQLNSAYKKILKESYQGAITVRDGIINTIETIPEHPYKYPPDKLKNNNTGNYRAFEL
ncbi:MAG TPA: hypothetical protein VJ909_04305 [Prolixibacteraceae bacterium]|nr:hypothetical protein [Prolixibacteraceae bacterium]